jgi:3-hydroxybutyryl-CoA dehydrogenase
MVENMKKKFSKIGIAGAGTMGITTSVDLLLHGISVILVDISQEQLETAKSEIIKAIRFAPMLVKEAPRLTEADVTAKVHFTTSLQELRNAEFVVENITEKWELKEKVYKELDALLPPEVCIGMNTSCTSITKTAGLLVDPGRLVGVHFMNPVYLKSSVEVIRGFHTSENTLDELNSLLVQLGKDAVIINDLPGFVSNRISHLFMNEAMFVVQDQVADAAQVDTIFKKCYGHTMGPLETADLIGLDTVMHSIDVLFESYQDSKFRCCPLLRKMVHAGLLGRKSGKGFYEYNEM